MPLSRPAARSCGGPGCKPGCKERGELAELAFLYRAAALGLGVLKPMGDSLPYDVAVDNGHRLLRVQVKSVSRPHRGVYEVNAGRGRNVKRAYTARDIDFLAACIFSEPHEKTHRRGRRERRERREDYELSSRALARDLGSGQRPTTDDQRLVWFIFPVAAFSPRKTIRLSPLRSERWTPFREAWHLLTETQRR